MSYECFQTAKTRCRERAEVLFRAADLAGNKYRDHLNATTIVGQGKTIIQAEIDAACELVDFFRFAAHFALELAEWDPISTPTSTNKMIYRAMEVRLYCCSLRISTLLLVQGFVASISPFNFTAIGGNLGAIPTLMVSASTPGAPMTFIQHVNIAL